MMNLYKSMAIAALMCGCNQHPSNVLEIGDPMIIFGNRENTVYVVDRKNNLIFNTNIENYSTNKHCVCFRPPGVQALPYPYAEVNRYDQNGFAREITYHVVEGCHMEVRPEWVHVHDHD
jgi:hypothetical protein